MTTATKLMKKGTEEGIKKTQKTTIIKLHENDCFSINHNVRYLDIDSVFVEANLKESGLIN
ncbi:MAG: hypothetical protein K9H64_11345 [Bacteroidales bacterium]|nr:hypothetical protein [Bacteroidales bacterium]